MDWKIGKGSKASDNWPKTGSGDPVSPVFLRHITDTQYETEIILNLLKAYGVPAVCQYPNDGEFGKLILGVAAGGIDIFVPETLLEDAQNILNADICGDEEE